MNDAELAALLEEFKRLHEDGGRPDPAAFLVRAGTAGDDFADLLDAYLAETPAPAVSEVDLDRIAASSLFDPPTWAQILVDARTQEGVLRSDLVARLTTALGLRPEQRERVAEHVHDLETGVLPPSGVSKQVIDALDGILRGVGAALERTRRIPPPPMPMFHEAFSRDAAVAASMPEHYAPPDDEVDALFRGRTD